MTIENLIMGLLSSVCAIVGTLFLAFALFSDEEKSRNKYFIRGASFSLISVLIKLTIIQSLLVH